MRVLGAIAATCADIVMNVPADAACPPAGDTYTITGTSDDWIRLTMSCIELTRPPGVSSLMTTARASVSSASSMPRSM